MTSRAPGYADGPLYYVTRPEVIRACAGIDVVTVVRDVLRQHAAGSTMLPEEAYLGWQAPDGAPAAPSPCPAASASANA